MDALPEGVSRHHNGNQELVRRAIREGYTTPMAIMERTGLAAWPVINAIRRLRDNRVVERVGNEFRIRHDASALIDVMR